MRGFSSCFADHSSSCIATHRRSLTSSAVHCTVTTSYRSRLSTRRDVHVELTWSQTRTRRALLVSLDDAEPVVAASVKGSRSYAHGASVAVLHWDLSTARYGAGPEPASGFCVAVVVDGEFALLVGDRSAELAAAGPAESALRSRTVRMVGRTVHSMRACFWPGGREHEIVVRWHGEAELAVCVDRKRAVSARNLRWNFRGNETVFIDGAAVDVMWDLHGWLFDLEGCAVLLFRTRSLSGTRLWLEEGASGGFSLSVKVSPLVFC